MLNILKQKNKNNLIKKSKIISVNNQSNYLDIIKHSMVATKEWYNSIYAYNKNTIKSLPVYDNMIIKIIKSYFNFYKTNKNKKKSFISYRLRLRKKLIRLSTNKIFASKAELKHTNNKIIIIIYIYNEQERYFLYKLKRIDPTLGIKKRIFLRKIKYIKLQGLKIINLIKKEKILNNTGVSLNTFKYYERLLFKNFIRKCLRKEIIKVFYLRKLSFNKRKFDNNYLIPLNKLLNNVYKKKIEFNLINLKYFYLNSDIFSQAIAMKIKNKKKLLKTLKASLNIVKLPLSNKFRYYSFNKLRLTSFTNKLECFDAIKLLGKKKLKKNIDILHQLLKVFKNKKYFTNYIETAVLSSIRLKSVNGIRLETSGRLSRRFTASRSIFKVKYKGTIKNIYSSYKGLPSVLLRGHLRSNLQYTNIASKTRNGSFGLKGWISSE